MTRDADSIFEGARARSEAERDAFLSEACADDPALRAAVEARLSAEAETLEPGDPGGHVVPAGLTERPGQQIGRYKLLQSIGEGGFGTVWMAEQREPVKRRVALKVIKLGMDTKHVIARFEAERQALAMMDHPHIARVLDAGATDVGRPFFVMEYIRGVPILEYCDTEKLDPTARLRLVIQVCNAIQHAHQKGIIHRDIKPSNILVTLHDGVPVCKVIDFGIAKATSTELTQKTLFTEHRQLIGTPAYMSPEQAEMSGLDIDTRTDIYALGVLLYELLTGTTPFDTGQLMRAGFGEMVRIIREEEPRKPSTRLSSLGDSATRTAQQRRVELKQLNTLLRGDLDWIVMKCLEKDRTRRYETANALALDIERHLRDEPVMAGPPSSTYKLRKFVKRNRRQALAGAALAATVVLGLVGTSVGLARAISEKDRADAARAESDRERVAADEARRVAEEQADLARAELNRSEQFKSFMVDLLGSIEPDREHPERSLAIRELLDTAYAKLEAGDVRDAEARGEVVDLLSETAQRHFWTDLEIDLLYDKVNEARESFGREDERTVSAAVVLMDTLFVESRVDEAESLVVESMDAAKRIDQQNGSPVLELRVLTASASVQSARGNFDRALRELDEALVLADQVENPAAALFFNHSLRGRVMQALGRLEEAFQASNAAKEIIDNAEVNLRLQPWITSLWMGNRAELMLGFERYDEALALFQQASERSIHLNADDYSSHIFASGAAFALQKLGRAEEALETARAAREGMILTRAPESFQRNLSRQVIVLLAELGRTEERDLELARLLEPPGIPLAVYRDGAPRPYTPSGLMGQMERATMDLTSTVQPFEGDHCFEWRVMPGDSWVALAWVEPAQDWGDLPGGFDLRGASRLSFMARGANGGERLVVGAGVIENGDYPDSLRERLEIDLTTEWQRFTIPLASSDLSIVRGGFVIESSEADEPRTVYFDNIRFE